MALGVVVVVVIEVIVVRGLSRAPKGIAFTITTTTTTTTTIALVFDLLLTLSQRP